MQSCLNANESTYGGLEALVCVTPLVTPSNDFSSFSLGLTQDCRDDGWTVVDKIAHKYSSDVVDRSGHTDGVSSSYLSPHFRNTEMFHFSFVHCFDRWLITLMFKLLRM